MNNKIIAAGVVVALCAVALIGVGYAYTATVTDNNQFNSEYVTLTIGDGTSSYATQIFEGTMKFDTQTTIDGTQWRVSAQSIENNGNELRITKTNANVSDIKLSLSTTENESNIISNILYGATITFSKVDGDTDDIVFKNKSGTWAVENTSPTKLFDVNGTYKATLNVVAGNWNTVNQPPASSVSFTMTLTYDSNNSA